MFSVRTMAAVGMAVSALAIAAAGPVAAKVEGDTITLGSAISFTGKYSTNGIHAKNGYDLAVTSRLSFPAPASRRSCIRSMALPIFSAAGSRSAREATNAR